MPRPLALFVCIATQLSFLFEVCHPFTFTAYRYRHSIIAASSVAATTTTRSSSSSSALQSQILDFIEPTTGVQVKLIGAMHYNPASIQLATDSINALAAENKLGSIIIESCDLRWNATVENQMIKNALMSEMKAAYDLGIMYQRPVVLGDQRINVTVSQLQNGAKEAVLDLLQPWNGGWVRLIESISTARKVAVPLGDTFLGLESFFDPKLLAAAPVSLVKYPLSYLVKSPMFAAAICTLILLGGVDSSDAYVNDSMTATDIFESLSLSVLETIVFARIFLKELLAERNEVLASNIVS